MMQRTNNKHNKILT